MKNVTPAQLAMLRAIERFADDDEDGWAEIELQFISQRTSDRFPTGMESALCLRVGDALRRRGLIDHGGAPRLTSAGREVLARAS